MKRFPNTSVYQLYMPILNNQTGIELFRKLITQSTLTINPDRCPFNETLSHVKSD